MFWTEYAMWAEQYEARRLHSGRDVHSVAEEAILKRLVAHHSGHQTPSVNSCEHSAARLTRTKHFEVWLSRWVANRCAGGARPSHRRGCAFGGRSAAGRARVQWCWTRGRRSGRARRTPPCRPHRRASRPSCSEYIGLSAIPAGLFYDSQCSQPSPQCERPNLLLVPRAVSGQRYMWDTL